MLSDLSVVFRWWLYLFGLGLIFLPLTRKLFANFFDQGYLFSKVLAILFSSYLVWLLASLKILPFFQETIWLVLILGILFNLWLSKKNTNHQPSTTNHPARHASPAGQGLPARLPSEARRPGALSGWQGEAGRQSLVTSTLVFEELLFLAALVFWSYIRGLQPDIQGLEKFMDYGFVNSILRSKFFPPADMWFAGKSINYYYYGHYVAAFLTKLSGIPSAITYNLMIATLFAFCFSLIFSLTANLVHFWQKTKGSVLNSPTSIPGHIIIAGLLAACLASLGANFHPGYYNFKMKILHKPYCTGSYNYWYPDATRYIGYCPDVEDKTIHEFPSYSFIVSDLHGHVSDIPFVILFLALCLKMLFDFKEGRTLCLKSLPSYLLISFLLGIMFMTNQWDFPIYLMILGFVLWFGFYHKFNNWRQSFFKAAIYGIIFIFGSVPFFLPFQLGFEPITKGVAFVWKHSLPHQLLILWGVPWFFGLTLLIFLFGKIKASFKKEFLIKRLSSFLGVNIEIKSPAANQPVSKDKLLTASDLFVLILLLVGTILVAIPEIIYVKDIYIPSYHRANTVFKLTYQSFVMFSILMGYIFIRLKSSLNKGFLKNVLFTVYGVLLTGLLIYPFYAIPGYYGKIDPSNYKGLYGLNFLDRLYPDDYAGILWLNKNVSGQPVVLEAVGDSYTDYERISMATGLPTIEGWLVHEWLWRGSYDEPGKRNGEVQQIYETTDPATAENLLKKYLVRYVVVGEMERKKYPNLSEEKFNTLGKVVFSQETHKIYQLN